MKRMLSLLVMLIAWSAQSGCAIGALVGGMAQNAEYQKLIQVLPEYEGLQGKTIAVLVNTDMSTLYEYPQISRQIAAGISMRIQRDVPGAQVMNPDRVIAWQFNTAQWSGMPYADIAHQLNVDRIVYVDLYEYRLHPPGNRWLYEGVCAATVGVIERESSDPDAFAQAMNVTSTFPPINSVTKDEAAPQQIHTALLTQFIRQTAWLFHEHVEPKYPDRYQGAPPTQKS